MKQKKRQGKEEINWTKDRQQKRLEREREPDSRQMQWIESKIKRWKGGKKTKAMKEKGDKTSNGERKEPKEGKRTKPTRRKKVRTC